MHLCSGISSIINDGLEIRDSFQCALLPYSAFVHRRCGYQPEISEMGWRYTGWSSDVSFSPLCHEMIVLVLCLFLAIFPANMPLALSFPSSYFIFFLFLLLLVHLRHLFHSHLKENPHIRVPIPINLSG